MNTKPIFHFEISKTGKVLSSLAGVVFLGFLFAAWQANLPANTQLSEGVNEPVPITETEPDSAVKARIIESYGKLPLSFEANHGQTDHQVQFLSRGPSYTLFLTPTEAVLALRKTEDQPTADHDQLLDKTGMEKSNQQSANSKVTASILRMQIIGANATSKVSGMDELPGKSNYLIGNDSRKWARSVAHFERVKYEGIYPGIDLAFYGNQRQLEYDFIVAPGADPKTIRLGFTGVDKLIIDAQGQLVLQLGGGKVVVQHAPVIYQEINGKRQVVEGGYILTAYNEVAFEVATYDTTHTLLIDPVLIYSTYLGGSNREFANGIAVDMAGNAYVTGQTFSIIFPVLNEIQSTLGASQDAFVTKLDASGQLAYSTYLGGSSFDRGFGIAIDVAGNVYLVGDTGSTDFPLLNAAQSSLGGFQNAFVTKLDASGQLVFSTYLGGNGSDEGHGIAVDTAGNAYITGHTFSTNFPTMNAAQPALGGSSDAFVTKLDTIGQLVYSTYLGGSNNEDSNDIAVDMAGNAYVAGVTGSIDFPLMNAIQSAFGGGIFDSFIIKLNVNGQLAYSTYLGGSGHDFGNGIAVDAAGNVYVAGDTGSTDFPILNAAQPTLGGFSDAFVTKLDATGQITWSTYLGGNVIDRGNGIAVDAAGNVYVAGDTESTDFPILNASQPFGGVGDAFVAKLDTAGQLVWSTYLGGSSSDFAMGVAVDAVENIYLTGSTQSTDFPSLRAAQPTYGGGVGLLRLDAFVTKVGAGRLCGLTGSVSSDGLVITYTFAGTLDEPFGSLAAGAPFTGSFNYNAVQPNLNTGSAPLYRGDYRYNLISLTFGSATVTDNGTGVINLYDHGTIDGVDYQGNPQTYPTDLFHLYTFNAIGSLGGLTLAPGAGIQLVLQDVTGAAWSNTTLLGAGLTMNSLTAGNATFIQLQSTPQGNPLFGVSITARGALTTCANSNQPPVANAGAVQTVESMGSVTVVTLNGSASSDPDGDSLTYTWTWTGGSSVGVSPTVNLANGTYNIKLTVDDGKGATTTATTTVTVQDTVAPMITIAPIPSIEATGPSGATVDIVPYITTSDVCAVSLNISPVGTYALGSTAVNVTATDCAGNPSTATAHVIVADTTAPALAQPTNITGVESTAIFGAVVTFGLPAATDSIDATPSVVCTLASGSTFALGTTTVTCTATDHATVPNSASVSFKVNVVDTTAPILTVPANVSVEATGLQTPVAIGVATATDIFAVTITSDAPATYGLGVIVVTWTATDANGNVSTGTQNVTVLDTTAPVLRADLMPFSRGDGEGYGKSDSDEGRFKVQFTVSDTVDASPAITAELIINGFTAPVAVTLNQIIEFEFENEKTQVEMENGVLEIEAPSMLLRVTATDASGNSTIVEVQPRGLTGDNDVESDASDD